MNTNQRIKEIIAVKLGLQAASISDDATLAELEIDSLDMMDIALEIEDAYGIEIDDGKLAVVKTVSDLAYLVEDM